MKIIYGLGLLLTLFIIPVSTFAQPVDIYPYTADFSSIVHKDYILLDVPLVIPPFLYRPVQMPDAVTDNMMQEWGKLYNASLDDLYCRNMTHY